MPVYVVIS